MKPGWDIGWAFPAKGTFGWSFLPLGVKEPYVKPSISSEKVRMIYRGRGNTVAWRVGDDGEMILVLL